MRRITVVAAAICVGAGFPLLAQEDSQGFLRVVEGAATLIRVEDGQPEAARENTPALAGDRLSLAPGSRVELILPDGHRLRLAESADLELVALARSLDEDGDATALQLTHGALAIDVPREAADRTRVDTDAAAVLLERGGLYLIEIDDRGATRVVVREGEAEVLTEYDSLLVRAGDEAVVDRDSRSRIAVYQAPPLTDVELWARQLEAEAAQAEVEPVDPGLRYAAQPLARYGNWVNSGVGYAWRPRVEVGWRPYWKGYWKYSPAGLVWCSYEPWGWVPYHYGTWDLHPSYGWLWYPGAVYRPAHVVWYWGPSYTGWIPSGYYASFYARRFGFHISFGSGFYGYSHASWNAYRDWVFCPRSSIGHRYQYRYHSDHHVLVHHGRFDGADRAFITADTGGLDRTRWRDAGAVEEAVVRRAHRRTGGGGELPDVTAVVARSPEVSGTMLRDFDSGDDERQVAVHRRPGQRGGPGAPVDPVGETVDAPGPSTRVGQRRPTVLADDGVARQTSERAPGAEGTSPSDGGRTAVRAYRSPGLQSPDSAVVGDRAGGRGRAADREGAASIDAPGARRGQTVDRRTEVDPAPTGSVQSPPGALRPVDRSRARPQLRDSPRPQVQADEGATTRVLRRTAPGADGRIPYEADRGQGRAEVVRRGQGNGTPRSYEAAPGQRSRQVARGDDGSSSEVRSRAARPPIESASQQPRARVEPSFAPRTSPRQRVEPSNPPRPEASSAPRSAPRAQVQPSYAPRSAPRAQVQPSYAPPSAPRARAERSYTPQSPPPANPRSSRESRSSPPAAASAPASAPRRMEASSAPTQSRAGSSSSSARGEANRPQTRESGSGSADRGGGGRGHASRHR
jgi:hypothetical protein